MLICLIGRHPLDACRYRKKEFFLRVKYA